MTLLERIKKHEGFRANPYPDVIHGWDVPTFGHGLTYITELESEQIVKNRIQQIQHSLRTRVDGYFDMPHTFREVLIEMSYQMGVPGMLRFKKMLAAAREEDWQEAADQMLDSKWANQTPMRAMALSEIVRGMA